MAEQPKYKSPEELGEAVGKKIEELFGGLFGEDKPETESPSVSEPARMAAPVQPPPAEARERVAPPPSSTPPPRMAPPPSAPPRPQPEQPTPQKPASGDRFDGIIEQIEILVLSMEWEVNPQSAKKVLVAIQELGGLLPQTGQAKTILAMNLRVLQHFGRPDVVPHPVLMRFLQDSIAALKTLYASRGKRSLDETMITGLTSSYKEIMSGTVQEAPRPTAEEAAKPYATLVNNMGNLIHSLAEVGRRLARILGVLRQGGKMSGEEITRRLGTLENLLSQGVSELATCHRELVEAAPDAARVQAGHMGASDRTGASSDGLWLMVWAGIHLAIPSSLVSAVHPLTKAQAQDMVGHRIINLGSRSLQLLPLKRPEGAEQVVPNWLVHLSYEDKDFFVLVDKSLGFRRMPEGLDINAQQRIKVGPISYAVLNQAIFGK